MTRFGAAFLILLAGAAMPASAEEPLGFSIDLTLSPKAAAELARLSEGITVLASYYGDPTPASRKRADEAGQIDLGHETVTVDAGTRLVRLGGKTVVRKRLAWIKGKPMVNVNVFSARRSGPDNILDCDLFEDAVAVAVAKPPRIGCKLIKGE